MRYAELPYPPHGINHMHENNGRGGRILKPNIREWKALCELLLNQQCVDTDLLDGDVHVSIAVFPPNRRADTDSRIKLVLDTLQGYAYANDKQVKAYHVYEMQVSKDNPRVVIAWRQYVPTVMDEVFGAVDDSAR